MKFASLLWTALLPIAACSAAPGPAPSARNLQQRLAVAKPGSVITLPPGKYGDLRLSGLHFSRPVTIRAANPAHPPQFGATLLTDVSGLAFDHVAFIRPLKPGERDFTITVAIEKSRALSFSHVFVASTIDGNYNNDGFGISAKDVSDLSIRNSEFTDLTRGVVVERGQRLVLEDNDLHGIRSDGFDFTQVQFLRVARNRFSVFRPIPVDHPDAIQIWTANATAPSTDIEIVDNLVVGDEQGSMQGIFITRQAPSQPGYRRVTITGNQITGAWWNGIMVTGARDIVVANNRIVALPGTTFKTSWIRLEDDEAIQLRDNAAGDYQFKQLTALSDQNSRRDRGGKPAIAGMIRGWDQRFRKDR